MLLSILVPFEFKVYSKCPFTVFQRQMLLLQLHLSESQLGLVLLGSRLEVDLHKPKEIWRKK